MLRKEFTDIDWERIELYMKAGADHKRIAESFGLEPETLRIRIRERYGEPYQKVNDTFKRRGELLIEATQFQKALSGNVQMLLWLGKIRCGQKEPENVNNIPPNQSEIDKDHVIMQLKHKIQQMSELLGKDVN